MEKQFIIKQKLWVYIVAALIMAALVVSIIINLLALFNVANMASTFPPLDIVAVIIMAAVLAILPIFVFFSRYKVSKDGIARYIGFFKEAIKYEDIYLMRVNSSKTILLLYVKAEDEEKAQVKDETTGLTANLVQIYISQDKMDDFISAVKANAKDLAFEILPDSEA